MAIKMSELNNQKMNISGGTFTGDIVAPNETVNQYLYIRDFYGNGDNDISARFWYAGNKNASYNDRMLWLDNVSGMKINGNEVYHKGNLNREEFVGPPGPQGPPGKDGPQGPTGPAGTTDWNGIVNKPSLNFLPLSGGTISGNLTVTGSILSNDNVTAYSDRRLKTNLKPIENSLNKVCKLTGYTFNMIGQEKQQVGVIAQELKEVLPEAVVENENGLLSVDYSKIAVLLIGAIKEIKEDLENIKRGV